MGALKDVLHFDIYWILPEFSTIFVWFVWNENGRCLGLPTLPPSYAKSLLSLGTWTCWKPEGLSRDCFKRGSYSLKTATSSTNEDFDAFNRGADKSLARPGRKQARKHVRDARDINNIETRAVIKFFFRLQGKASKEIHAILTETLVCFLPGRAKDLSAPLTETRVPFPCSKGLFRILGQINPIKNEFAAIQFPFLVNRPMLLGCYWHQASQPPLLKWTDCKRKMKRKIQAW